MLLQGLGKPLHSEAGKDGNKDHRDLSMAIISFSDQDTESCFHDDKVSVKCSWASLKKKAKQKLDYLNSVTYLEALRVPPSNHLELLKGDLAGFYSIRVNERWRIIFRWTPQGVEDVEVIDYHHG